MPIILMILLIWAVCAWIHAEKGVKSTAARIGSGAACFLLLGVNVYTLAGVDPTYERMRHQGCLRKAGELLAKGETQKLEQAIGQYNSIAATGTTYQAARQMWELMNETKPQ